MEGGISRADLMHQVIDAQSIEAKLDFTVKRDAAGSVLIRWCPEIKYCDMRMSPAGMMGMFPSGSNHQGMLVYPLMSAQDFLSRSFLTAQQASMARDRRMLEIQQQLQDMDRQIVEHRQRTNAEIQNDAYLTMMEQEEYVNPYTGEPELGSNQWKYRWVTEGGEEYYTDNEDTDPNVSSALNRSDWKCTPVRPRFPQWRRRTRTASHKLSPPNALALLQYRCYTPPIFPQEARDEIGL
jgi:hypothetical protein